MASKVSCLVTQAGVAETDAGTFNPFDAPDCIELILVDEADRLKMVGLEHLRDVYDRGHFGLVLIGMPGIEKRLARYAQLYSRVGFVHQFRPLSADELRFLLQHHWSQLGFRFTQEDFTDVEAVATIIRITGGNFRLLQRLCTQIERILEINQLQMVTKEVIEAARESLVIGSL
jgi:DNA transposition AAA+ family ATPase